MEPQRWQRVQDLYHEAAAQAPSERAGFLQARCTGDSELLSEVNALLASHDEPSTFLEPPTEKLAWLDTPPPDLVGQVIGNCTLTRLLGEGGMGAVYEGVQAPLNRPVAVKVLRAGLLSPSARERFEHESKILGQLRHAGIAQVFEAGTAQVPGGGSLPYFVMERIPGALPLKKAMDARGQNLRERVATFLEVARAVGHGHERGVIHRDLKPGNVLVDENGQPKVIDFGIARLTHEEDEREFPTMEGMLVGTLQYMSPEQLRGKLDQVDTRSDVYALGIMMYEAFLDERPHHFDGQDLPEILERVLKEPPLRPRRANPKFDPDLEAILLCAVALERSERYATASALAEDLDRFLRGEPVVARAITFGSSLGWFAKRHRRLLIAGTVVLAVALAGAAVSLHFAWEANQARAAADRRADQALRLVQSAQDLAQWTITNLDVELADLRGSTRVRRLLADRMQGYLATLGDELPDAPGFRRSLARALLAMAEVEGSPGRPNAGRPEAALERAREAEALLRRLATDHPHDPEAAHDLAAVHLVIAELVAVTSPSDVDEAFRTVQRSESAAAAVGASGARWANLRSAIRHQRAQHLRHLGQTTEAKRLAEESLLLAIEADQTAPDPDGDPHQVIERSLLSDLQLDLGDLEGATRTLEPLRILFRPDFEETLGVRAIAREASARRAIADLMVARGDAAGALEVLAPAVDRRRRLAIADPHDPALAHDLVVTLQRLAALQMVARNPTAARATLEENLVVTERCSAILQEYDRGPLLAIALLRLGMVHATQGEIDEAKDYGRRLVEHLSGWRTRHSTHPELIRCEAESAELQGLIAVNASARFGPEEDGLADLLQAERHFLRARDLLRSALPGSGQPAPLWLTQALANTQRYLDTIAPTIRDLRGSLPDRD